MTLLATSVAYAAAEGLLGLTFNATPLVIGVGAVVAGLLARQSGLIGVGLTLTGWGAAVLAVREGPLPDNREAAAFLVGAAVGLLGAHLVTVRRRDAPSVGPVLTVLFGGFAFYLTYDVGAVGRWPFWAVAVAAWAAVMLVRPAADRDR